MHENKLKSGDAMQMQMQKIMQDAENVFFGVLEQPFVYSNLEQ